MSNNLNINPFNEPSPITPEPKEVKEKSDKNSKSIDIESLKSSVKSEQPHRTIKRTNIPASPPASNSSDMQKHVSLIKSSIPSHSTKESIQEEESEEVKEMREDINDVFEELKRIEDQKASESDAFDFDAFMMGIEEKKFEDEPMTNTSQLEEDSQTLSPLTRLLENQETRKLNANSSPKLLEVQKILDESLAQREDLIQNLDHILSKSDNHQIEFLWKSFKKKRADHNPRLSDSIMRLQEALKFDKKSPAIPLLQQLMTSQKLLESPEMQKLDQVFQLISKANTIPLLSDVESIKNKQLIALLSIRQEYPNIRSYKEAFLKSFPNLSEEEKQNLNPDELKKVSEFEASGLHDQKIEDIDLLKMIQEEVKSNPKVKWNPEFEKIIKDLNSSGLNFSNEMRRLLVEGNVRAIRQSNLQPSQKQLEHLINLQENVFQAEKDQLISLFGEDSKAA